MRHAFRDPGIPVHNQRYRPFQARYEIWNRKADICADDNLCCNSGRMGDGGNDTFQTGGFRAA